MSDVKRVTARVQGHVDKLREAGLDTQMFFDALTGIRDDTALPQAQREALYKLVAMESFIWYLEALRGKPIDRVKLAEETMALAEANAAAIKKREDGDVAAALAAADIDAVVPKAPPPARPRSAPRAGPRAAPRDQGPTRLDRPPRKKG
ncbi:MAG: hypothetical protein H6730_26780 [Deltaproteobacteria bacterium]|nr:hypothetical protein [Deltaproteobacteria bacterium]